MEQHNRVSTSLFFRDDAPAAGSNVYRFSVIKTDGKTETLCDKRLRHVIGWACLGYESCVDADLIFSETIKNVFDGISPMALLDAIILSAVSFIERDDAYSKVAVRVQLRKLFKQTTGISIDCHNVEATYRQSFIDSIKTGLQLGILDKRM